MKFSRIFSLGLIPFIAFVGCKKEDSNGNGNGNGNATTATVDLKFDHRWTENGQAVTLGTTYTHPETGEDVEFTTFRYYVSNIVLIGADGTDWVEPESYYIVDLKDTHIPHLHIHNVPLGDYTGVRYTLGVDSTRNVSGAQTGALSPEHGMFWSWVTGYIFAKIEGNSAAFTSGEFMYHTGGFSGANNAIQTNTHAFGHQELRVRAESNTSIHLKVNVNELWKGESSFSDIPNVHMPGANAVKLMNNFGEAVYYDHLHN